MLTSEKTEKNQSTLIQIQGRLDVVNAAKLQQQLGRIDSEQSNVWILDLTEVEFIDSAGLVALVTAHKTAVKQHCQLVLCNPSPAVRVILEISQLDRVFEVVEGMSDLATLRALKASRLLSSPQLVAA
jgi:anti-sigma B factor antagonist